MAQDSQEKKDDVSTCTSGISHIGLSVESLEKTFDGFFAKLGFKQVGGDPNYPSKFITDGKVMVTLWQLNKNDDKNDFNRKKNVGLHHIAFKVDSKEKLDSTYNIVKDLKDVKIEFKPQEIKELKWWHFMCYEPSGIRVEFTWHGD